MQMPGSAEASWSRIQALLQSLIYDRLDERVDMAKFTKHCRHLKIAKFALLHASLVTATGATSSAWDWKLNKRLTEKAII
jgi:hypothetical protein